MSSESSDQTLTINQNRYKLLELFCQYDLGNLSVDALEQHMTSMGIKLTQAYRAYMRKQCGTLKFNEFVKVLTTSDDTIIDGMMTNTASLHPVGPSISHQSRGLGLYNTSLSRYSNSRDFLKWKAAAEIHRNEQDGRQQKKQNVNLEVNEYPESMRSTEEFSVHLTDNMSPKELIHLYCRGLIDIDQFEERVQKQSSPLTAQQQRVIAKCKIHPDVKLTELYLAFADPKAQCIGNFDDDEAFNAQREPLIFVDHPVDIITWNGDDPAITFREMTKRKTFHHNRTNEKRKSTTDMLHWDEMTNQEFNAKVTRKRPPCKGGEADLFRSHIVFDDDVCPMTEPKTNRCKVDVARMTLATPDLLKWRTHSQSNEKDRVEREAYRIPFEKFRHDDRVPYMNE